MRTIGTIPRHIPSVVSIVFPVFSFSLSLLSHARFTIDLPEISGGSTITPSSSSSIVSHSVTATSSPTSSSGIPSPGPIGGISTKSSSAGAIAGGVVGGIAAISIAIAAIFFYRRRRPRPPAAVSADVIESKPLPFSKDEGTTAPSSPSGSPVTMRFYVRVFVSRIALVCPHVLYPFLFLFT